MAVCHNYSVSQPPNAFHKGAVSIESQPEASSNSFIILRGCHSTTEMELWKRFYADVESAQSIRRHFCRIRGKAQSHKYTTIRPIGIRESVFKNLRQSQVLSSSSSRATLIRSSLLLLLRWKKMNRKLTYLEATKMQLFSVFYWKNVTLTNT